MPRAPGCLLSSRRHARPSVVADAPQTHQRLPSSYSACMGHAAAVRGHGGEPVSTLDQPAHKLPPTSSAGDDPAWSRHRPWRLTPRQLHAQHLAHLRAALLEDELLQPVPVRGHQLAALRAGRRAGVGGPAAGGARGGAPRVRSAAAVPASAAAHLLLQQRGVRVVILLQPGARAVDRLVDPAGRRAAARRSLPGRGWRRAGGGRSAPAGPQQARPPLT